LEEHGFKRWLSSHCLRDGCIVHRTVSCRSDDWFPSLPIDTVRRYGRESLAGLVSRVTPVQTALRNCTGDEGRPFGFGDQVADPKPPRAAAVKSRGGERHGKVGTMIPAGMVERRERKRTAAEASKAD